MVKKSKDLKIVSTDILVSLLKQFSKYKHLDMPYFPFSWKMVLMANIKTLKYCLKSVIK